MSIALYQVDAFTSKPFAGNPAAVCLLEESRPDDWMKAVAAEMNLSETAFLVKAGEEFRIRWFTPKVEVALCGHATLASAHILLEEGIVKEGRTVRFLSASGPLSAERRDGWIELNFPARLESSASPPAGLTESLGCEPRYVGRNVDDYLLLLESEEAVRRLAPDFVRLGEITVRGVIATAPSADAEYDFVSRFFAPRVGVNEDPVTGSAHCCLALFWQARLGKNSMTGRQLSSRGGVVRTRVEGERVMLGGAAVTVVRGELLA